LQGFSSACKMPANGSILMRILFSAFQEIYSGCCTVAAHPTRSIFEPNPARLRFTLIWRNGELETAFERDRNARGNFPK
jgi:hypothetical protein